MRNNTTLKSLTCISLILFFLPFLQTCSDESLKGFLRQTAKLETTVQIDSTSIDGDTLVLNTIELTEAEKEKITKQEEIDKANEFEKSKIEHTHNVYYLGLMPFEEIKIKVFKDPGFYCFLAFPIIILCSVLMVFFAFKFKNRMIYMLAISNIILLLISTLGLCLLEVIEDINQIKYGYYLFCINSFLIILISRKRLLKNN